MKQSNFLYLFLPILTLISLFSGCKKEKSGIHKQSFFSKVREKHSKKNDKAPAEVVKAFDLNDETMKSFALDDKLPQHKSSLPSQTAQHPNNLLAWENLAAEDSKQDFKRLFFDFNSYGLGSNQNKNLKFNTKQAKQMIKDGKTIVIEGHACHSAGSAIYNLALSEKRARHVAKKFAETGIDAKNIKIAPRGHEMPIVKSGNREEQAANRRVEIFAIDS